MKYQRNGALDYLDSDSPYISMNSTLLPTISSWIFSKSTSGVSPFRPGMPPSNDVSRSARHIFRSPPFGSTRATADSWRSSCRAFRCNTPCVAWRPLPYVSRRLWRTKRTEQRQRWTIIWLVHVNHRAYRE